MKPHASISNPSDTSDLALDSFPLFSSRLAFQQHTTSVLLPTHDVAHALKQHPSLSNDPFQADMPSRYAEYDTDDERLPEGMQRVHYDADTQVYTFRDANGSLWEGPPGSRYGHLTKVSDAPKPPQDLTNIDVEAADGAQPESPPSYDESEAAVPLINHALYTNGAPPPPTSGGRWNSDMTKHWRAELMPLLNFFMILALFLVGIFWFLGWMTKGVSLSHCESGSHAHRVQQGETCWSIAQMHDIDVGKLAEANLGVDCDLLKIGGVVCVPAMPKV